MPESFCRQCGLFLPDLSKPVKRELPPEDHLKANTVLNSLTIIVSFTLSILLFAIVPDKHPLIYATAGILIAIGGWHIQTLIRTQKLTRSSIEITSGTMVPDLAELIVDPTDREWLSKSFSIEREKLNADSIIEHFLQRAGWRWYTPFKTRGVLGSPVTTSDGSTRDWNFSLTLRKDSAGRRQLEIER